MQHICPKYSKVCGSRKDPVKHLESKHSGGPSDPVSLEVEPCSAVYEQQALKRGHPSMPLPGCFLSPGFPAHYMRHSRLLPDSALAFALLVYSNNN